ncbi:MAG: undecaprenyl-diphosphate phosphatase [Deltaproteobacteria bacterium]|jgi:undecaprenyl-diphosphatase|nr:undecaprenyl-diphosphate phosphatase [Deltaproteobacteria bacterium]
MSLIQALILGVIQGLTEFLPISSSGHLVIFQNLFGLKRPDLFFNVALHFGTLLAILIVLRQEVSSLLKGTSCFLVYIIRGKKCTLDDQDKAMARFAGLILIGLIPTAMLGFFLRDVFRLLFNSLLAVGIMLIITGTFLWLTKMTGEGNKDAVNMSILDAIIIGFVQGLSIAPGISRSGATIAFGLFGKLKRMVAIRFSFLLSIPAILGAIFLEWENPLLHEGELLNVISGTLTAALVGYICLRILIRIVQKGHFHFFSPYCWALGSLTIILSFILK